MKIVHILLLFYCIIHVVLSSNNDFKARLNQKHENNKVIETTRFIELETQTEPFDPKMVLRKMEDIKAKAALHQAAKERENKIHELEAKLADLAMDKRRAAEKLQTEEVVTLEKRVLKMEEVTNQLSRSAHQQIGLLKEIQERQHRTGSLTPRPVAHTNASNGSEPREPRHHSEPIPLIDTAALDYVFKKVITELRTNPPKPSSTPLTGPGRSTSKPLSYTSSTSIITTDTYKPKPSLSTPSTVTLPSPTAPSKTVSKTVSKTASQPRFATMTDVTDAINRAFVDYSQSPGDAKQHVNQQNALLGLIRPALVPRMMLHNLPSAQQSQNSQDPTDRLPLIAEYQ